TPSSTARLTITASARSEVLLDGVPLGTAPLESIRVEPGAHEVTFIQDGKRSTERLTIRSGEHKRVDARSDPPQGEGLDEAAVKRTIAAHRSAVVETCWDSAFGARAPGDPTSIRVPVTIGVEPSGVVRSVVTTTEPAGYPELRRCIEQRVAPWRFPSARAETVVNVAFVFVLE
ncbi:MAG: AgmX/PglI C-terminal domain-containing protein, partial [Polyangiaceae bacterium]